MFNQPFTPSQVRPIRPAMTVSRPAQLGQEVPVTWFSLGAGTSITPGVLRLHHPVSGR